MSSSERGATGHAAAQEVRVDPGVAVERLALDETSWVDVARGLVTGADLLFDALLHRVPWRASRLFRYDHRVEERRPGAYWRPGRPLPHPALAGITRDLQRRCKVQFGGFGLIQYRNGRDGQAFHRDTDLRWLDETVIAVLTLGARRPWLLRPRTNRYDHSEGRELRTTWRRGRATCWSWAAVARPTGSTPCPTCPGSRSAPASRSSGGTPLAAAGLSSVPRTGRPARSAPPAEPCGDRAGGPR